MAKVDIEGLVEENRRLREENRQLSFSLQDRYRELAEITKILYELEQETGGSTPTEKLRAGKNANVQPGNERSRFFSLVRARLNGVLSLDAKKKTDAAATTVTAILASGLFDREWYLSQYPDVAEAGVEPVEHYVKFGWREGRNPSARFDTASYLAAYPDFDFAKQNPLLHHVQKTSRSKVKSK